MKDSRDATTTARDEASSQARSILAVEHDAVLRRALSNVARQYGEVVSVTTAKEAGTTLSVGPVWRAFILSARLPDASGLDVLALARSTYPCVPAIVLGVEADPVLVNAAYDLRAQFVVLPFAPARIERFLAEAQPFGMRLLAAVRRWRNRYRLSDAEGDVLRRAAFGESRYAIADARSCSELTVKKHVANILARTTDESLHGAVERLLREVAGA